MAVSKRAGTVVKTLLLLLVLVVIGFFILIPFFWMLSISFKKLSDIFVFPLKLIPRDPTVENYGATFTNLAFIRSFLNSIFVACAITAGSIIISAMAGYALAKYRFRFRNTILLIIIIGIMIPIHVVVIPLFLQMNRLGLINSYFALILPFVVSPWGIFLVRQFLVDIPNDLIDAARIDGAREFRIFWFVVLPLSRPVLAVLAVITFLNAWNEFLWPVVAVRDEHLRTLPLYIAGFFRLFNVNYSEMMASAFMATLPVLVIFFILQKQFISGLTYGSFK